MQWRKFLEDFFGRTPSRFDSTSMTDGKWSMDTISSDALTKSANDTRNQCEIIYATNALIEELKFSLLTTDQIMKTIH